MPVERVIPEAWLSPSGNVKRVIMHWTAGGYTPSAFDRLHYHFLIDGQGKAVRGPRAPGQYLPHVLKFNTGSVGLSICAMAGAVQGKTDGKCPITKLQWERACQAAAEILHRYNLPVDEKTVCCHSEVTRVHGVKQRGKWDVDRLPYVPEMTPTEVHNNMRAKIAWYWDRL